MYDYGVRGEDWMTACSASMPPVKRKYSFETYRKRRYCPVPGCTSRKPLKKLSNHLTALHPGISPQQRAKYLKDAKVFEKQKGPLQVP